MARVEILTGVERRRVWTEEDKLRILEEVETSGSGVAEVARRHDISPAADLHLAEKASPGHPVVG